MLVPITILMLLRHDNADAEHSFLFPTRHARFEVGAYQRYSRRYAHIAAIRAADASRLPSIFQKL